MKLRSRVVAIIIVMTAAAFPGCRNKETPGASGSAAAVPQPTANRLPFGVLDTPREGSTVANKSWGTGWALDDSGIFQVTATADNGAVAPAKIGQAFPGVKEAHPELPDNDRAGFIFALPDLPSGPHTLKVEILAKDSGRTVLTRSFNVQ